MTDLMRSYGFALQGAGEPETSDAEPTQAHAIEEELLSFDALVTAMDSLTDDGRRRALRYLQDRYGNQS